LTRRGAWVHPDWDPGQDEVALAGGARGKTLIRI
jgi:hypothetical protein